MWLQDGEVIPDEEGPTYTVTPQDRGKEITVVVVPEDGSDFTGTAPADAPVSVEADAPSVPKNIETKPAPGGITVTWEAPEDDGGKPIEEYKITVKDEDGNSIEVVVDPDTREYTIPDLDPDKEYIIEIVASNGEGDSDPEDSQPVKPEPDTPTPGTPSGSGGGGGYYPANPSPSPGGPSSPTPSPTPCPKDETCPIAPYPDANPKAWYHDGLHYCIQYGIMIGYDTGLFGPSDHMTRAQLAMILYNLERRPDNSGVSGFIDVPEDQWYAKAITWASANQVMIGYNNGRFGPNDRITREQLAAAIYRYTGSPAVQDGSLEQFTDQEQISSYARAAMLWAVNQDLLRGIGNDLLDPQGTATRAQVGTMIYRYCMFRPELDPSINRTV